MTSEPVAQGALRADRIATQHGILGMTLRELLIVGVWALLFVLSFLPLSGPGTSSIWLQDLHWVLTVGVPTAAVFLIVLRRFSPDGIRRVGSLRIDQFASVAFSVAAFLWLQQVWDLVAAWSGGSGPEGAWVPVAAAVLSVGLVVLTVVAPLIPGLREDFEGRVETAAHRNANPVRPVASRPVAERPAEEPRARSAEAAVGEAPVAAEQSADDEGTADGRPAVADSPAVGAVVAGSVPVVDAPVGERAPVVGDASATERSPARDAVMPPPIVDAEPESVTEDGPEAGSEPPEAPEPSEGPVLAEVPEAEEEPGFAQDPGFAQGFDEESASAEMPEPAGPSELTAGSEPESAAEAESAPGFGAVSVLVEEPEPVEASEPVDEPAADDLPAIDEEPATDDEPEQTTAEILGLPEDAFVPADDEAEEPVEVGIDGPGTPEDTGATEVIDLRQPLDETARFQPFWVLAPDTRPVVDDYGVEVFRIGPEGWVLVIEDRGGAYVVRHDDGRVGYLHDLFDLMKG